MEILILLVFLGLFLVLAAFLGFAWTVRQGTLDHSDRLALLPLETEPRTCAAQTHGKPLDSAPSARPERT